jgi:hypothetical protein
VSSEVAKQVERLHGIFRTHRLVHITRSQHAVD